MGIFDRLKKKQEPKPGGYYFENPVEFMTYVAIYGKDREVNWISPDKYIAEFKKGYQLFEEGKYKKAIETYRKCLELNPIGINARFEICEANLKLGDLDAARDALLGMKDYLGDNSKIAQFYRRFGYIEIEKKNLDTAVACYQYSVRFEKHPSVVQELMYIRMMGGPEDLHDDPKKILADAGIPIITK